MKNLFILLSSTIFSAISMTAQTTAAVDFNHVTAIEKSSKETKLSSEELALEEWKSVEVNVVNKVRLELEYPELARENGVEGTVIVQFSFDGEVNDIKIIESVGLGCDEAAVKAIANLSRYYKELGGSQIKPLNIRLPFKFSL